MSTGVVSQNTQANNWPIALECEPREAIAIPYLLIKTQPLKEHVVVGRLVNAFGEGIGFESYLPMITLRRFGGRGEHCPLFPGYVFSRIPVGLIADANEIITWGRSQVGIGSVVRFGLQPAVVSEAIIGQIKARHGVSGVIDLEVERERMKREIVAALESGQAVTTNSGPFRGVKAIFQAHRGEDRVILLYQILGGQRSVELPAHQVVKV